jgi:subtilisin family serine protease
MSSSFVGPPVRSARCDGGELEAALSRLLSLALVAAALLLLVGTGNALADPPGDRPGRSFAKGRILVAAKPDTSDDALESTLRAHGSQSHGRLRATRVHEVRVPPGQEQRIVEELRKRPDIEFAEVDELLPPAAIYNDPYFGSEWHLSTIGAPAAWDQSTGRNVTIAILDTGVDGTHPDLAAQMVPGWNFYANNSDTRDAFGHGTTVAGAAAAISNNNAGVASVAGGARIMPVRIADANGNAYASTMAQAITWAADHGARVVSVSFTGAAASSAVRSAAQYLRGKGGVLIVAAGNTGTLDRTSPTSDMTVVAATDQYDRAASFTTYGSFVSIAAPGVDILTTAVGGAYWNCWGTSLATPIVAGVAALIIAARPDFTAAQIDAALYGSATDLGAAGRDEYFGYGRVNAAAAVASALGAQAADKTPPNVAIAAPLGGTVGGSVAVTVNASDNVRVTRVDLRVNGTTIASDAAEPYQFTWNSASVADGSVTLDAVAFDAAGNSRVSPAVGLLVANAPVGDKTPPSVAITSPAAGTAVKGVVAIAVNATDNVGVTRVDVRVNGSTVATTNVAPYQVTWDASGTPNGTATLTAVAFDAAGNAATSTSVAVLVANSVAPPASSDTTPPVVTITTPGSGSTVSGNTTISANASDNSGAAGITQTLYIDGVQVATATGAKISYKWNSRSTIRGPHTIRVTARDRAGNTASAQVQVTTR